MQYVRRSSDFKQFYPKNGRFRATSRPYRSAILVWIPLKLIGIIEGYNTNFHAKFQSDKFDRLDAMGIGPKMGQKWAILGPISGPLFMRSLPKTIQHTSIW